MTDKNKKKTYISHTVRTLPNQQSFLDKSERQQDNSLTYRKSYKNNKSLQHNGFEQNFNTL